MTLLNKILDSTAVRPDLTEASPTFLQPEYRFAITEWAVTLLNLFLGTVHSSSFICENLFFVRSENNTAVFYCARDEDSPEWDASIARLVTIKAD
jgi:hypothetical protein